MLAHPRICAQFVEAGSDKRDKADRKMKKLLFAKTAGSLHAKRRCGALEFEL